MDFDKLQVYINLLVEQNKRERALYENGLEPFEFTDSYHQLMKMLWEEILTPEGLDWFEWFIWEKGGIEGVLNEELDAWDENKNPICQDLKGLHEYLTTNKYFRTQSKD